MMKVEFEELVGYPVSNDDYKVIEYVYTWHPSIDEVHGKQQIATLYKVLGMPLIHSMVDEAKEQERNASSSGKRELLYKACMSHIGSIQKKVTRLVFGEADTYKLEEALGYLQAADEMIGLSDEEVQKMLETELNKALKELEEVLG